MKRRIALLIAFSMLFGIIFGSNVVTVNAVDEHEYTDQYDDNTLLSKYSTTEIVALYPEFSSYLAKEMRALNTDISVAEFNLNKKDIGAIFFSIITENPDIFYIFPTSFETTINADTDIIISIRPEFFFDIQDIPAKIKKFNEKVDYILAGIDKSWSDVIKARYLHDTIAQYTEYDTKYETISSTDYERYRVQMRIYTAYGALVDNNAVCEGYAEAYNYLLSKVGIESHYIQSVAKRHAWNLIKINGYYYHIDITHDDPSYDTVGRVGHSYFMKSDTWVKNDDDKQHALWVTNLKAADETYDRAWWNDVNTVIYRINGYDYYINQRYTNSIYAAFMKRNISTGTVEFLKTVKTRWYVAGSTEKFWDNAFTYLTSDGKYLYFNDTSNVYRYEPNSGDIKKIYEKPSTISGDIYGLAFKSNGTLYASIKASTNDKDILYALDVSRVILIEPSTSESSPGEATDPAASDTSEAAYSNEANSESSEATDTGTEETTDTEPITAPPTEPVKADPVIVKKTLKTYLKHSVSISLVPEGAYKFSSSNKSVVTVTSKGIITAKKKGKATVTAKSSSVIFKLIVTVRNPKLNVTKKTLKRKKSFKLKVIGGTGKIVLKNSNSKVISLKSSGKVTAQKKGKATISVKVSGLTLKCKVTVK